MARNTQKTTAWGICALVLGGMIQLGAPQPQETLSACPQIPPHTIPAQVVRSTEGSHASLNQVLDYLRREKVYTGEMRLKSAQWDAAARDDYQRNEVDKIGRWYLHFETKSGEWLDIDVNARATKYWDNTCRA